VAGRRVDHFARTGRHASEGAIQLWRHDELRKRRGVVTLTAYSPAAVRTLASSDGAMKNRALLRSA
jgi:hypothetical protein